ncbi:MAG: hypothetical protein DMG30_17080 [Acidobacteria bacterium]|nr:MAG: hypothetical protein DMG30_17080 [Acidobacteriota bacterium]
MRPRKRCNAAERGKSSGPTATPTRAKAARVANPAKNRGVLGFKSGDRDSQNLMRDIVTIKKRSMKREYNFSTAKREPLVSVPKGKTRIRVRLADDVLEWFHDQVDHAGGRRAAQAHLINPAFTKSVKGALKTKRDSSTACPDGNRKADLRRRHLRNAPLA